MSFTAVKQYSDNVFRVMRYARPPVRGFSSGVKVGERTNEEKLDQSRIRARSTIIELALCNKWDYFITFTVSPDNFNRYELFPIARFLTQWLRDQRKQVGYEKLAYILVPEKHADGAWHFHGFMSGIPDCALSPFVRGIHPLDLVEGNYLNWGDLSARIGYCSLDPVRDQIRASFYCSKYFTKDILRNVSEVGCHMYYCSRGLLRAVPVGWCYESNSLFDNAIEHKTPFCDVGWMIHCDALLVLSNLDDINADALFPDQDNRVGAVEPDFEQMYINGFPLSTFYSPYGGVV